MDYKHFINFKFLKSFRAAGLMELTIYELEGIYT